MKNRIKQFLRVSQKSLFNDGTYKSVLVETNEIAFDLLVQGTERVCGRLLYRTEHPTLFLDVHDSSLFMRNVEKVRPEEMQLFTYINAKLLFFSKKVGQNFGDMNAALSQKRCQQTTETIKNRLALASLNPDLFAFSQNDNQPGMSAKLAGEVVHLFKCQKKSVTRRNVTDQCFEELPVLYEGKEYFVTPLNRILSPVGSPKQCADPFPSCYNEGKSWFSLIPHLDICPNPEALELQINTTVWKYKMFRDLLQGGIYTERDLQSWQEHLVMPAESHARQQALNARYYGTSSYNPGGTGLNLMTSVDIASIGEKMWNTVTGVFNFVGHTTSVVLGILSMVALGAQCTGCSVRNVSLIRMHGCTFKGMLSTIPGGQLMIWAREKLSWKTDLERLLSLSDAELVQLGERMREAYAQQNLEFPQNLPQNLYPNLVGNEGVENV